MQHQFRQNVFIFFCYSIRNNRRILNIYNCIYSPQHNLKNIVPSVFDDTQSFRIFKFFIQFMLIKFFFIGELARILKQGLSIDTTFHISFSYTNMNIERTVVCHDIFLRAFDVQTTASLQIIFQFYQLYWTIQRALFHDEVESVHSKPTICINKIEYKIIIKQIIGKSNFRLNGIEPVHFNNTYIVCTFFL